MHLCLPHWDKLRAAIADRGMADLISKDGHEALERVGSILRGQPVAYDPLLDCNVQIISRAVQAFGPGMMGLKEDGSRYCPVCVAVEQKAAPDDQSPEEWWIGGPADAALSYARTQGLVPGVQ